jgi:hypothetical protein
MKNNLIYKICLIVVITTVIISMSRCKKNSINSTDTTKKTLSVGDVMKDFMTQYSKPADAYIEFKNDDQAQQKGTDRIKDNWLTCGFFADKQNNNKGNLIPGSYFKVNGRNIEYYDASKGYGLQSLGNTPENANWLNQLFGTKVKLAAKKLNTSSTATIGDLQPQDGGGDFYVPDPIVMVSDFTSDWVLNIQHQSTITWTPDPDNPNGKVFIGILYRGDDAIEQEHANVPPGTFITMMVEAPDNGQYTLTPSQVANLPIGGEATVFLGRGNYQLMTDPNTGLQVMVSAFSVSHMDTGIQP